MPLTDNQRQQLQNFFNQSHFEERGAVITDLDGTAIHEFEGRYSIPQSVELGLNKVYELGRPVVLNTLRFPLSVIRTFGREWYKISNAAIPTVLMNGSQLGYIVQDRNGEFAYEEITAFPLRPQEINNPLQIIENLAREGVSDLLVFYYPRNWKLGEIIWTPVKDRVEAVGKKYLSASTVYSSSVQELKDDLLSQEICMIFLLIEIPQDKLMAYQHTKRSNFFTRERTDKQSGAEEIARQLKFELRHSVGAGDSEMDNFLKVVGLAIHVGNPFLNYEGLVPPIKLKNSSEFGELLFQLAAMQRSVIQ
jgi:hydroxymethylpyrimidine pyrophosphatase-like HAD family hydrolase